MILNVFQQRFNTMNSKFCMFNELEQLQKIECDLCFKKFSGINFKKHRKICNPKLDQEHPKEHKCLLCEFSTDLKSCLTKHIQKEHLHPVTHQCNYIIDVENDIHCHQGERQSRQTYQSCSHGYEIQL